MRTAVLGVCSRRIRRSHRSAGLSRESESVQKDFLAVLNFMIVFHDDDDATFSFTVRPSGIFITLWIVTGTKPITLATSAVFIFHI